MRSRPWRFFPLALLVVSGSCSSGTNDKKDADRAPSASLGEVHEPSNPDGPGLRGTSTDALRLPVPRAFDLSHVEPRYFAAALGNDPNRIFDFVRDQIAFEPYRGSLRGPRGTLMAMAGNGVDRAALLASLLASSKQRVRFAHGKLKQSLAEDLVASIWPERPSTADTGAAPSPELTADLGHFVDGIHRDALLLAKTLHTARLPDKRPPALTRDMLVKEAQDHYWVEWWQDGQWTALDPSFATSAPGQKYAESDATFDELPDSLFHHIAMRLRAEEYQNGQPASRQLLEYSAKAADLSGVDLFLSHQRVQSEQGIQLRPVLAAGLETVIGMAYTVAVPRAPAQSSGALADALAGDAQAATPPIASALFVDFDLVAPDGKKETVVREIFDRVGKQRRMAGSTLSQDDLAGAVDGPIKPDALPRAVYDFFITTGAVQNEHLRRISSLSARAPGEPPTLGLVLRMINIAYAMIADGLTSRVADSTGHVFRTYPDAPRIYVAELSDWKGTPRFSLDLRRDLPRVAVSGFDGRQLFAAELLRGVIAGAVEREVVGYFAAGNGPSPTQWAQAMSTNLVFERAQAANIDPVLLSGNSPSLSKDLSPDVRARIDETLAAGQLVVAPSRPVEVNGDQRFAWWGIDPSSGASTAVTDEGLYQTAAEGSIIRQPSGEVVLEVRAPGTAFEQYHAANAEEAVHWVRNITRTYKDLHGINVYWDGLPQLWADVFAGL
jgi:hypothetical protein